MNNLQTVHWPWTINIEHVSFFVFLFFKWRIIVSWCNIYKYKCNVLKHPFYSGKSLKREKGGRISRSRNLVMECKLEKNIDEKRTLSRSDRKLEVWDTERYKLVWGKMQRKFLNQIRNNGRREKFYKLHIEMKPRDLNNKKQRIKGTKEQIREKQQIAN